MLDLLPTNAAIILEVHQLTNFKSELKNNAFLSKFEKSELYTSILEKNQLLDQIETDQTFLIAYVAFGTNNFDYVLIAPNETDFFELSTQEKLTYTTLPYEGKNITEISFEEKTYYSTPMENYRMFSSSKIIIENAIRSPVKTKPSPVLAKLMQSSLSSQSVSIYVHPEKAKALLEPYLKEDSTSEQIGNFSDWMSLDFNADQQSISLSGVVMATDSTKHFTSLFKGTKGLPNRISEIAPASADALLSYTFDQPEVFFKNQDRYIDRMATKDTLFNALEEVGSIFLGTRKMVILSTFGTESLSDAITAIQTGTNTYQGSEILQLSDSNFIADAFPSLYPNFKSNFCTIVDNSFVFATTEADLQTVIANLKSNTSFASTAFYKSVKENLSSEASVLFVAKKQGISQFLEHDFKSEFAQDFDKGNPSNYVFAHQLIADSHFFHSNTLITEQRAVLQTNAVSPLFTLQLDSDIAFGPQFVKNHRTNTQEIVIQDSNNNLYLISTSGKILWKKELNGTVQGSVTQVDLFKNRKLQLAFCTNNQFLILDRNGKEVDSFAKKFEGGNLNPLAVFDYENNKDYRFIVTQSEKVFMYNSTGKTVNGFTYTRTESPNIAAPQHFRIAKKDYLVFRLENGALKVRHRAGGERISIKERIQFSENDVFLYKNKISFTDENGVLFQIDSKGKLSKTNFNLNKDHGLYATSKTLALMNENILTIKGKKVELELGVYTAPKIFYIYDKIYVSVTDLQNQKIYLFDSQAKSISNFPVFGSSLIDLTDMDNDRKLEIVTKDQENSIIVYSIN